ncbi:MAG: hypothetical protein KBA11_05940 [Sedimentibacter sp.]|nr:hypothetical protein [Sedimentibacter sp.]
MNFNRERLKKLTESGESEFSIYKISVLLGENYKDIKEHFENEGLILKNSDGSSKITDKGKSLNLREKYGKIIIPMEVFKVNFEDNKENREFREKLRGNYLCEDGHYVRSRAEQIIDNFLYNKKIVHAVEKKIPGENLFCDFYLPLNDIYIEYWGLSRDNGYDERKRAKKRKYKERGLRLLEIEDNEIVVITDVLSDRLYKLGALK